MIKMIQLSSSNQSMNTSVDTRIVKRWMLILPFFLVVALGQPLELKELKKKAEKGDRVAQYQLGMVYDAGIEDAEDTIKEGGWYLKVLDPENAAIVQGAFKAIKENKIKQDKDAAIMWFRKAAKQDLLVAQVALGTACAERTSEEANKKMANESYRWFMKAAKHNDPVAFNGLGILLMNGVGVSGDLGKAKEWLQKGADIGYAPAQFNLGQWYELGPGEAASKIYALDLINGVKALPEKKESADYAKAFKWIRLAADQGYEDAQMHLVMFYLDGLGVEKDVEQAVFFAKKFAESGDLGTQLNLGLMYLNGTGVNRDLKKGFEWVRKSAEQDLERAQLILGELYEQGIGVDADAKLAADWNMKAAKQGSAVAEFRVFLSYVKGQGFEKDEVEAAKWCAKSAQKGYLNAERAMGYLLFDGTGVEKNPGESMVWFKKAADKGDPDSQFMLGAGLFLGKGVEEDYIEAFKWLTLAGEYVPNAKEALSDLNSKITPAQMAEGLKRVDKYKTSRGGLR